MISPSHHPQHWLNILEALELIGRNLFSAQWNSYETSSEDHARDARVILAEALGSREVDALLDHNDGSEPFPLEPMIVRDPAFRFNVEKSEVEGQKGIFKCVVLRSHLVRYLAQLSSASADPEAQALEWLIKELQRDTQLAKRKKDFRAEIKKLFAINDNAFERNWLKAIPAAGTDHSRAGRRRIINP